MSKIIEIKGQERVVSVLNSHLKTGNISHAYLFMGNNGVGKSYIAKEFARLILCSNHKKDSCDSCMRLEKGSHPDFIFIDGGGGIKIEAVREAIERINLSPNMGNKKVVLFSAAENLGHEAANALLKTLEEPPLDSVIILTAISDKSLPQTVVSRAQKIRIRDWSQEEIVSLLSNDYSEKDIKKAIKVSGADIGSVKKYLSDVEYRKSQDNILSDVVVYFESKFLHERFGVIEKYDKEKRLKEFFYILTRYFFVNLAEGVGEENSNINLNQNVARAQKILKIYENLNYNVNLRTALEELTLEIAKNE